MIYGNEDLYKQFSSLMSSLRSMQQTVDDGYWRIIMSGAVNINSPYEDFCRLYQKEASTIGSISQELMNVVQAMTYTDTDTFYDGVVYKTLGEEGNQLPEVNGKQSYNSLPRAVVTRDTADLLQSLVSDMMYVSNVRLSTPTRTNNQLLNTIRFYGSVIPKAIFPRIGYAWSPVEGMNDAQRYLSVPAYGLATNGLSVDMSLARGGSLITPDNTVNQVVGRPFTKLISEVLCVLRPVNRAVGGVTYKHLYMTLSVIPADMTGSAYYFRTRNPQRKDLYQSYLGMNSFIGQGNLSADTIAKGVSDDPDNGRTACDVVKIIDIPGFPADGAQSGVYYYTQAPSQPDGSGPYQDFRYVTSVLSNWTTTRPNTGFFSAEENVNTLEKVMLLADWKVVGVDVSGFDISGKHYPTLLLATQIGGGYCQIYKYLSDREASQLSLWSSYPPFAVRFGSGFRYQKVWHAYGPNA